MERATILLVDDDAPVRSALGEALTGLGYSVRTAADGPEAIERLTQDAFEVVLLDLALPGLGGLEILRRYRARGGAAPVIVISGQAEAEEAARAIKQGATEYLAKPCGTGELAAAITRALTTRVPAEEVRTPELRTLISASPSMRRTLELVERIADTDVPVLLLGESGTGKEVVAREIHRRSRRNAKPFIKVNCAALPSELLESELFGHEKGAFTGATAEKPGKFELADQGTIFLDEIGEMAIRLQAKLLQVLQDEDFYRVGGKKSVRVDARVVVATNRELEREIARGNFREDLFYRLNVVAIRLPPLRERRDDIGPLVQHFLSKYGQRYPGGACALPDEVLSAFHAYSWPGNVRELENMVRRLVVLQEPRLVLEELRTGARAAAHLAPSPPVATPEDEDAGGNRVQRVTPDPFTVPSASSAPGADPGNGEVSLKEVGKRAAMLAEREAILAMLQRTAWNKRKAAAKLKISYKALLYKIKESGIIDPRVADRDPTL